MGIPPPIPSGSASGFHHKTANYAIAAVIVSMVLKASLISLKTVPIAFNFGVILFGVILFSAVPAGAIGLIGARKIGGQGMLWKSLLALILSTLFITIEARGILQANTTSTNSHTLIPHHPEEINKTKGQDLRYDIEITKQEEDAGLSRVLEFKRPKYILIGKEWSEIEIDARVELNLKAGWTNSHPRQQDKPYHYIVRMNGHGGYGAPTGNNGDLYVTIRVH